MRSKIIAAIVVVLSGTTAVLAQTKISGTLQCTEPEQPSREAALARVLQFQLGRRNLTEGNASRFRGKQLELEKNSHGGDRRSSGKSFHLKTSEKLAKEYKVTGRTIQSDAKFSRACDVVYEVAGLGTARDLIDVRVTARDMTKLAKLAEHQPSARTGCLL
jgi:hypothetical protein